MYDEKKNSVPTENLLWTIGYLLKTHDMLLDKKKNTCCVKWNNNRTRVCEFHYDNNYYYTLF